MNFSIQDGQCACFSHDGLFFGFPMRLMRLGIRRGVEAMNDPLDGQCRLFLRRSCERKEALLLPQASLVMLDHVAHHHRIALAVAVAQDWIAAARGINAYV